MTVWHVDPERDGSDDSCGWVYPKLTEGEVRKIGPIAREEQGTYFDKLDTDGNLTPKVDALAGVFGIFGVLAWRVWGKDIRAKHLPRIISLSTNHIDGFTAEFRAGATIRGREVERLFYCIARAFKRMERPWWKHPRFHVWHYEIQVHPVMKFKRWAFSRCSKCGRGFLWGYSPISHQWNGSGPRWFRSERGVEHQDCNDRTRGAGNAKTAESRGGGS